MGMKSSRWLSLMILCTGFLLIVIDMTIVNVALPSIQRDMGFSQSGLAWVINAYLIAFGGFLLLAGRLGDLFGRKRIYLIGLGIFIVASVLCGLSFDQRILVAARFVQGIGGAVSAAVILAMIVTLFPKQDELAKAFGIFSFIASAGAAIGLLAGGLITQAVSWHWIFFVNLPIGLVTAVVSARLLPSDRGTGAGKGADVLGAALITVALMLGVYTIVESSNYGLGSLPTPGFGRGGAHAFARHHRAGPHVSRLPRFLLRGIAGPAARAWVRSHGDRPRVLARGCRDGSVLGAFLGAADQPIRPPCGTGQRSDRDRPCFHNPWLRTDQRELCGSPDGSPGAPRPWWRPFVPGAGHHRDG